MSTTRTVAFTVLGEPASKANSRKIVRNPGSGKIMSIKSQKARNYERDFRYQCPKLDELLTGDVSVTATIYYASRRPDLDESIILDCMQGFIYANDRQVKEKLITWGLDKETPRAEIIVRQLEDA